MGLAAHGGLLPSDLDILHHLRSLPLGRPTEIPL